MTDDALEIRLLGPVEAARGPRRIALGAPRQRLVLAVLATTPGRLVPAERLIARIWGDDVPGSGTGPLRTYVSQLRQTLAGETDPRPPLVRRPPGYVLDVEADQVDANRFETGFADARTAATTNDWDRCRSTVEQALGLWRGPALADLCLEPAVAGEADRLDRLRADAETLAIDALLVLGRNAEVIARAQTLLDDDPLHEHLWAQMMLALYRSGRQSEALRCFSRARHALVEQLGVDPGSELRCLEQAILDQEPELEWHPVAPVRVVTDERRAGDDEAEEPGNLPNFGTSFVGRAAEQRSVSDALVGSRVVTLTGPGGAGKTRLALAVAESLRRRFDGGTWFVDLLAVEGPDLVARAVAAPFGVDAEQADEALQLLRRRLGDQHLLLVLDNCEHHLEPVAQLVNDLVRACPRVHLLATSREQLRVAGEQVLGVPPLALPSPAAVPAGATDAVTESDAVALFVERARAVSSEFRPVGAALDAVVSICRRLDGLPLAIELAAGLAGSLPVDVIAERLDDRFALLADGRRNSVPRQRTLQAALDDSFELLDEAAQQLFIRLGVFVGDFTLPAAEAVAGDVATPAGLARHLARLVETSMISSVGGATGTVSYRMLDTVRQYALTRLDAAGLRARVRRRHAHHYAGFAAEAERAVHGPAASVWLQRIEGECPDLRAALKWLFEHGDIDRALAMSGSLRWFFGRLGALEEAARWLTAGLDRGDELTPAVRVKVLSALCAIRWWQGEFVETRDLGERAVALAREVGDAQSLKTALIYRGHACVYEGDYARADECFSEAGELCERSNDRWSMAWNLAGRAIASRRLGRLGNSRLEIDRALSLFRELGDDYGRILLLLNLALISQQEGQLDDADSLATEAAELSGRMRDRQCEHAAVCILGITALARRRLGAARSLFVRALSDYPGAEHRLMTVMALEGLASLALEVDAHTEAALVLGKTQEIRERSRLSLTGERRRERHGALGVIEQQLGPACTADLLRRGAELEPHAVIELATAATAPVDPPIDLRDGSVDHAAAAHVGGA